MNTLRGIRAEIQDLPDPITNREMAQDLVDSMQVTVDDFKEFQVSMLTGLRVATMIGMDPTDVLIGCIQTAVQTGYRLRQSQEIEQAEQTQPDPVASGEETE
jgi:hypothetical protein